MIMRKMKKSNVLLTTVLAAAMVFTGCSSSGTQASTQSTSTNTSSTTQTTEKTEQTPESTTSEDIVLRCGVKQAHAPFSYLDDDGNLIGLEEDVVNEAFNRIDGYSVEIVGFDASPSLFSALQAGSIDFGSGQYVASAARKEIYKFPTQYYALSPLYLASREEDHFNSLEDIAGETLEMVSTSYEKEIIQTYNDANPGNEIGLVDVSGDKTTADSMQELQTGQKNVLLLYQSSFDTVQDELNIPGLVLSDEPVIVEDVYQVFNEAVDDEFIALFDEALKSMFDDGTLGTIAEKWTGVNSIELYKDIVIPVE
jgi:ABC-type amino acid transport substrate-binding protein